MKKAIQGPRILACLFRRPWRRLSMAPLTLDAQGHFQAQIGPVNLLLSADSRSGFSLENAFITLRRDAAGLQAPSFSGDAVLPGLNVRAGVSGTLQSAGGFSLRGRLNQNLTGLEPFAALPIRTVAAADSSVRLERAGDAASGFNLSLVVEGNLSGGVLSQVLAGGQFSARGVLSFSAAQPLGVAGSISVPRLEAGRFALVPANGVPALQAEFDGDGLRFAAGSARLQFEMDFSGSITSTGGIELTNRIQRRHPH